MKQLGIRMSSWSGLWLGIAALLGGAMLLWVGFALALVLAIVAGLALLPSWLRSLWTRKTTPRGPVTIEGHYTRIGQ